MSSAISRYWGSFAHSCKYLGASLAIILVKRRLRRHPLDWSLWLLLARLYEIGEQWPQAIDALEHAHQINPRNETVVQMLTRMQQAERSTKKKAG
ncbi:MAG: tetratricopeptide repeat protein [Deltaproteobacteria bacterium]|nr:MAG: tetratricopeptide repeat protein [Deltaproteobacteria bacterium]